MRIQHACLGTLIAVLFTSFTEAAYPEPDQKFNPYLTTCNRPPALLLEWRFKEDVEANPDQYERTAQPCHSVTNKCEVINKYKACCVDYQYPDCTAACNKTCVDLGGYCNAPYQCICPEGWEGSACQTPICQKCVNGICIAPGECQCDEGFVGIACTLPVGTNIQVAGNNANATGQGLCKMLGNYVKTFDGLDYLIDKNSKFVLVEDNSLMENFKITIENGFQCGPYQEDCGFRLCFSIELGDTTFCWEKGMIMKEEGTKISDFPVEYGEYKITHFGALLRLDTPEGLQVIYDGARFVHVYAPSIFKTQLVGLCGNFDGVSDNDLADSVSNLPINLNDFIEQNIVDRENDVIISAQLTDINNACNQLQVVDQIGDGTEELALPVIREYCETNFLDDIFAPGREILNDTLYEYIGACMNSLCYCKLGGRDCSNDKCAFYQSFAMEALANDVVMEWRQNLCPINCHSNKKYYECASSCHRTCDDKNPKCDDACLPGCECEPGFYWSAGLDKCVPELACTCEYNGKTYLDGEIRNEDCNNCTCMSGVWNCSASKCPGDCEILSYGYFKTFDNLNFFARRRCPIILTQITIENQPQIDVYLNYDACSQFSPSNCFRYVAVTYQATIYKMSFGVSGPLLRKGQGDKDELFPYFDGQVFINTYSSGHMVFKADIGLTVIYHYNAQIVNVIVDTSLSGKTRGVCGTFDYNDNNEFTTRANNILTTAEPHKFLLSWLHAQAQECKEEPKWNDVKLLYSGVEKMAKWRCHVLQEKPFSECHARYEVDDFVSLCELDVLRCEGAALGQSHDCHCIAVAKYAFECAGVGPAIPDWQLRSECLLAKFCEKDEVWYDRRSLSDVNCRVQGDELFDGETKFAYGCFCKPGMVYSHGKCIETEYCPCYYNGVEYAYDEKRETQCGSCTCKDGGWVECETSDCPNGEADKCDYGMVWSDCVSSCPQTCKTLNKESICLTYECRGGCQCPEGTAWIEGDTDVTSYHGCIAHETCPCYTDEKYYEIGAAYERTCQSCVCEGGGGWNCTTTSCDAICRAFGDPHYRSFDGKDYEFQGDCSYTLVTDECKGRSGTFSIHAENIVCGTNDVTCTKSITIEIGDETLQLVGGSQPTIKYPNQPGSPNGTIDTDGGKKITFFKRGRWLIVLTHIDITVMWDTLTSVYIKLKPRYSGKVCGLCGDYNNIQWDDFTKQDGSRAASAVEFGRHWQRKKKKVPTATLR